MSDTPYIPFTHLPTEITEAVGSARFGGFIGPPIDFREWWESKDHTYGGDTTPIAIAGLAWEAAHRKYAPPAKANPIDEAVRRMEEVPVLELNKLHFDAMDYGNFNDIEAVRARLIQAAKGEQP